MKSLLLLTVALTSILFVNAQDDPAKRASPPASVSETIKSGATITINYSQPSVKGRTIGTDLEPKAGQVWRTGANEATTFEVSKAVRVQGRDLPAGKYALFTIDNGKEWTIIFNKTANQWGAYDYKQADDALRVNAKSSKAQPFAEKMTFTIDKNGTVTLVWGDKKVDFRVD